MLSWSYNFIRHLMPSTNIPEWYVAAGIVVASLNLLIQLAFNLAFGDKSVLKVGGKR